MAESVVDPGNGLLRDRDECPPASSLPLALLHHTPTSHQAPFSSHLETQTPLVSLRGERPCHRPSPAPPVLSWCICPHLLMVGPQHSNKCVKLPSAFLSYTTLLPALQLTTPQAYTRSTEVGLQEATTVLCTSSHTRTCLVAHLPKVLPSLRPRTMA